MKIQCDVCDKDEAVVFCVADEAALCAACDHRVHHANKLAGKHRRFTLLQPSAKEAPFCDICQERRAFLFCQQDRAILCKECDISVHKANEHTKKHNRFLLTGVKLSATSALYSDSPSSSQSESSALAHSVSDPGPNVKSNFPQNRPVSATLGNGTTLPSKGITIQNSSVVAPESCDKLVNGSMFTSSISEYLMETLPGWHVEDFLDSSSLPHGFSKSGENDGMPFLDVNFESNMSGFPAEKMGFWVPQMPPAFHHTQNQSIDIAFGATNANGFMDHSKELAINNVKSSRKWSEDNSFAVPQISTPSSTSKRYRPFW